jgi:hypothetical protein
MKGDEEEWKWKWKDEGNGKRGKRITGRKGDGFGEDFIFGIWHGTHLTHSFSCQIPSLFQVCLEKPIIPLWVGRSHTSIVFFLNGCGKGRELGDGGGGGGHWTTLLEV